MIRTRFLHFALVPFLVLGAWAQFKDRVEIQPLHGMLIQPGGSFNFSGPLLDPARLHISHSMSMGYAGGSQGGVGAGLYVSNLDYRLSNTVDMRLQLGVRSVFHNSVMPGGEGENLVGGAEIRWQPSENFTLHLAASRGMAPRSTWPGAWHSPLDGWNFQP